MNVYDICGLALIGIILIGVAAWYVWMRRRDKDFRLWVYVLLYVIERARDGKQE